MNFDKLIEEIEKKWKEFIRKYDCNPNYIVLWHGYAPIIQSKNLNNYSEHFKELYLFGMRVIWTIKEETVEVY